MKKILWFFLCLLVFLPISKAENDISSYRIDMEVLENGDIKVIEAFTIDGVYNGFERKFFTKEIFSSYYGSLFSSIENPHLYDIDNVSLHEIRGIDYQEDKTFLELEEAGDLFTKVNSASKGDYGVYVLDKKNISNTYTIYNNYKMNKDFYLSYTMHNAVIVHEDIAELGIKLFESLPKAISKLDIYIHIPNNQKILETWLHGSDNSEIEKVDNETLHIIVEDLKEESRLDFRLVFDKDVIIEPLKLSKETVYPIILEKEKNLVQEFSNREQTYKQLKEEAYIFVEKAENSKNRLDYNQAYLKVQELREKDELKTQLLLRLINLETKIERNETIAKTVYTSIITLWLLGLVALLFYICQKFDKKYRSIFLEKYHVVTPKYPPSSLGYLFHRTITNKDLLANILDMINRKIITYEKQGNEYILKQTNKQKTELEERMIKLLFNGEQEVTLAEISNFARQNYKQFLNYYASWLNKAHAIALEEKFYEDLLLPKAIGIIYCTTGTILGIILLNKSTYYSSYSLIVISLSVLVYFLLFIKKTKNGSKEYALGKGLKRFMEDYGVLSGIDVYSLTNYIPYAISLKCIDRFLRQIDHALLEKKPSKKMDDFKEYIAFYQVLNSFVPRILKGAYLEKNMSDE